MWQLVVEKILIQRFEMLTHGVFSFTNNSKLDQHASRRTTIKPRATGLKQLDLGIDDISYPVPIVVHETIASGCTVKRRSTPAVRMQFSVTAGRGGQCSFRRRPGHAP